MTTDTTETVVETAASDAIAPEQPEVETEASAESSPAVNDADESTESSDKPKGKGIQSRIDELTRNWREAERREAALWDMIRRQQPQPQAEPEETEKPKAPPTLEQFNYDEAAYQAALFQHVKDEAARVAREELRQEREREQAQTKKQTFKQREAEYAKANADYLTLTRDPTLPLPSHIIELAVESENGPAILYHLAQNRDVAERIAGLSPVAAAREVGRIEAKLEKPASAPAAKPAISKAPPPPPRIESVESAVSIRLDGPDADKLSMSDWMARRNKQLARRKG